VREYETVQLTPERIAELSRAGIVPATIELLEQMEAQNSPLVSLCATRNGDGTWRLRVTRVYDCPHCGQRLPDNPVSP
jgi:hypothetical protein